MIFYFIKTPVHFYAQGFFDTSFRKQQENNKMGPIF